MPGTALVIDDQKELATYLARLLRKNGYHAGIALSAAEAQERMAEMYPDVVFMDLRLPDADGSKLVSKFKKSFPQTQFIILTGHGSIRSAVESAQRGAVDYLTKPCEPEEILLAVESAMSKKALKEEVNTLRSRRAQNDIPIENPLGPDYPDQATKQVFSLAIKAAKQNGLVLLLGESGAGKDFLANWIHKQSARADGPFFTINCAALTKELAESELFGHEPGAFTGTRGRKRGLLELANKGTLLLNEIGELDLILQSKLLTFLDTKSFLRVGGEQHISIEARIFAATNRDLKEMVALGRFREDLYYRLNVLPIRVPSLRERKDDIPILVKEILTRLNSDLGLTTMPSIEDDAIQALREYHWPGNIRELRNVLERSLMLSEGREIRLTDLPITRPRKSNWSLTVDFPDGKSLHDVTREVARNLIVEALSRARTKQQAAAMLGLSRHALAHQIKILGIQETQF